MVPCYQEVFMIGIKRVFLSFILLAGLWLPQFVQAAPVTDPASAGGNQIAFSADDPAACADDPLPTMNGQNPAFAGKPINMLSGVEGYAGTDISIGSVSPITVTRRYDSRTSYDNPVGYGWSINYDRRIYTYPDGSVTLRKNCGWKRKFVLTGGTYITPLGETGTLVKNEDGSFTFTYKNGDKDFYDDKGRLAGMQDAKGPSIAIYYELDIRSPLWGLLPANVNQTNALIISYDYRLSRIEEKDSAGNLTNHYVLFHYDSQTGRLTDIVDSTGRTVTYSHDSIGNLTAVSGPGGSYAFGYTDTTYKHRMTSIDDGRGTYTNTYDAQGRVSRQTHGTGVIDFEYIVPYKKSKMTATIKDSSGNVLNTSTRTLEFDTNGQTAKVTDTFGNETNYTRDSNMYITREDYWENIGTISSPTLTLRTASTYSYDARGNVLAKTYAQGSSIEKTTTYTYHPVFNGVLTETVASVVNPAQNRVITNIYDETNGNLLTTIETGLLGDGTPYSYTTTYTYGASGKLASIDGPRTDVQDVTSYIYDPTTGFLLSMTLPIIGTTTYSNHDALGNPQTVTDPNGNSTIYTYDTTGRVTSVKAPGDTNSTQYYYLGGGCGASCGGGNKIDHITLPEGNTIWYTYNSMGSLVTIKDSLNNTINYNYDSEGNKLTEDIKDSSNTLQKTLSYQYDALNRLTRITNPDSSYTEYSYDFRGNRSAIRNPNAAITSYSYDKLNRLISVVQPGSITTGYGYNTNNNLTTVTDANNNTTTYRYDDKGRVYQVISPDTGTTTYQYDPAGNTISKTDAKGVTISYQYDALKRIIMIDFPSDTDIVYAYDNCPNGKGRLCSMTDVSGTTTYEYSPKGQVAKETKTMDSIQYITQYTYDQNGNLKTITYPSGKVITYNYTNDRAISVLNGAATIGTNIAYKPFGGITSITYGNGLTNWATYDTQYRLSTLVTGTFQSLTYNYDNNGNITSIAPGKTYAYDSLDRLGTATGPWGSLGWTYDGVGNRQTENSNTYTYYQNTNRLNTANGLSFGYDNNGNTTTEGVRQYIYNQNQRLIEVNNGGTATYYTYNGNGQRVKKVVNGTTTIFHYSLNGQIIAESNNAGTITAEYVYLNGQPLAKIEGANTYYYHNDHLATPQKMTDASGSVVWAADYKPFGEATITVSTITNNLRFPGQYFDAETGLNYNYYRDYNPPIGRYIESDPVGIKRGRNHIYVYVLNNSLRGIDPQGLISSEGQNNQAKQKDPTCSSQCLTYCAGETAYCMFKALYFPVCEVVCIGITRNPVACSVICGVMTIYEIIKCFREEKKCADDCINRCPDVPDACNERPNRAA